MKMKQVLPVLEYVSKLKPRQQKQFMNHAEPAVLLAISDLCANLNRGAIEISDENLKKLKKYKKQILTLCKKKPTVKQRRKIVQKGAFLPNFLSTILPAVLGTIFSQIVGK